MRLRYSAVSDVGRVRKDNQDAGYAGPHLLVIADGVGGAARGDLASSTAVEQLRKLDDTDAVPPGDMLEALAGAINQSHERIVDLVRENPEVDGTSTTVTAALFDGEQLAIGHVGDSRGYLLREGELSQLTSDHTFVQSLIDEGRITEEEARVHPHRNLILRAVDGVHEPEPDVLTLDLAPGDRLMLCSDGCSGVLDRDALAGLLREGTPDSAALELVRASLEAGSTDNVTVLIADVVPDDAPEDPEAAYASGPLLVGAAAEQPRKRMRGRMGRTRTGELPPVHGDEPGREGDPGTGAAAESDPEALRYAPREPRRLAGLRLLLAVVLVLLLVTAALLVGYRWTQTQYYVSNDGQSVVIYRGIEADLPGITLNRVEQRSDINLDELPTYTGRQVRDGISANGLSDARDILTRLSTQAVCGPAAPPTPTATPTPTPTPTPGTPKKKNPGASPAPSPSAVAPTSPAPSPAPDCGTAS